MIRNMTVLAMILGLHFASCARSPDDFITETLGGSGQQAHLQHRVTGFAEALGVFSTNETLKKLLAEFVPEKLSCGHYDYRGMKFHLGVAEMKQADHAYGLYSGLVSRPRERWVYHRGELSYKKPFTAGYKNNIVFWFYAYENEHFYSNILKQHGEFIIRRVKFFRDSPQYLLTYHKELVPRGSMYRDSLFYTKRRDIGPLVVEDAYGALYRSGALDTTLYIEKNETIEAAEKKYAERLSAVSELYDTRDFAGAIGPGQAVCWYDDGRHTMMYRYRWLVFTVVDVPELLYAENIIREIYDRMLKMREIVQEAHRR
jgi:hypothetical protein